MLFLRLLTLFDFPRQCLHSLRLDKDEVGDDMNVSVSEWSVIDEDVLSAYVFNIKDELKDNNESVGSGGFSCILDCCRTSPGGFDGCSFGKLTRSPAIDNP